MSGVGEQNASILVVDDNPLVVNVLKSLFTSREYNVYSSINGEEARNVLECKHIDLIICDVMMPEMDGYAFHEYVRSKSEFSHIPFVFLTALGSNEEVNMGKEVGADDYVTKPFDPQDLLAIVKGKVTRSRCLKNVSEEKYEAFRKRVIHTLSHEFRTPLVAINTGTELLLDQPGDLQSSRTKNLLEAIQRGGHRLERLVTDFMLLQQLEAGIAQRLFESRASNQIFCELVQVFLDSKNGWLKEQGFEYIFNDMCGPDVRVKVYDPQIHDILDRLIRNAVKFSKGERVIEVVVYPRSEDAIIEVRDRGIGIDVDKVKEAVDVFGQIDREKLEQQGSGLGLAIAGRYTKINQGKLEFENRTGGGSIVSLVLPIAP